MSTSTWKSGEVVSYQFPVGLRVLVVDDDLTCLKMVEGMLKTCRYEGISAFVQHYGFFGLDFADQSSEFIVFL